ERTAKRGRKKGEQTEASQRKYENTLDKKTRFTRYSHRASNCLPPVRTFRRSSPIRTPEKTSARSTGVGTIEYRRDEHARNGPGSDRRQDVWSGTVQDAHGHLSALR